MGIEGTNLKQESQALPQEELSSAQERFAKGLLSVAGVTTLEDAQKADWKFDSAYLSTGRESESTNYQVVPMEGSEQKVEDSTSRRCTLCHQPIKEVNLVGVNGQVVQMGNDCTAKLIRFIDTGEIVAENPRKEMLVEQSEILLEGAQYERGILEKEREALKWTDEEGYKKLKKITNGKIVASMMSWLIDHVEDEGVPEEVQYAIRSYDSMGMMPADKLAREVSEYYKSVRKFLPDELLKDDEVRGLKYHPHKGLLRNVIKEGVVQNDLPQLRRIIEKGGKIKKYRESREFWKERLKQKEEVLRKRKEHSENERKQEQQQDTPLNRFREKADKILEAVSREGLIEKGDFSVPEDLFEDMGKIIIKEQWNRKGPADYVGFDYDELSTTPINSSYQFDDDYGEQVGYLYTLEGSNYYAMSDNEPYTVITKEHDVEIKKIYTDSQIKHLNKQISEGVVHDDKSSIEEAIAKLPKTDCIVHKYSCAEVVVDPKTMQPVVLLKEGGVPLVQAIEEGKVVEWPM